MRLQEMGGGSERAGACQRALTQNQTLWGGGALEVGDLRLVEDGSERSDALASDVVASETASEGQDGNSERVGVSMGTDAKASANAVRGQYCQGRSLEQRQTLIYHVRDSRLNALERYDARIPLDHTGKQNCSCCTKALLA